MVLLLVPVVDETVVDEIVVLVSVPVVGACCIADKRT